MTEPADERTHVDRADPGRDPAADVREEYTSYRQREGGKEEKDDEAAREAELQPGTSEPEKGEAEKGEAEKGGE